MCLFVLCVVCLTVFVNCLVKQFAMCVGVVAILLLNVMDVFSVCGGALLDNNNNNNICLKSNIQTSSVDYAPRELTHACSRSETCSRSDTEACDMCYVF